MACRLCGGGDRWNKTVRDGEGQTFPACDPCYSAHRTSLVIVPGTVTVTARCDRCQEFVNPREIEPSTLRPAAWKEAYGGVCGECVDFAE